MAKPLGDLINNMTPAHTGGRSVGDVLKKVHSALIANEYTFAKALGENVSAKKYAYVVYTYVRKNEHLWQCDPNSIVAGAMEAAELGLSFSIRNECHLVPYSGNATFQCGYKGLMKLALNDARIQSLHAYAVFSNDEFQVELGGEPRIIHKPNINDRGSLVAFYAVAKDIKGNQIPEVMTAFEIEDWAKAYIKSNRGPFSGVKTAGRKDANFEAYGLKTVILRLCNRKLPLSTELSRAIEAEFETEQDRVQDTFGVEELPPKPQVAFVQTEAKEKVQDGPDFSREDEDLFPNI